MGGLPTRRADATGFSARSFFLGIAAAVLAQVVATLVGLGIFAALDLPPFRDAAKPTLPSDQETQVIRFEAFEGDGVTPALAVEARDSGRCFEGSFVTARTDARRCFSPDFVFDPCFAEFVLPEVTLVCATAPWADTATVLTLGETLVPGSDDPGFPEPRRTRDVWAIELVNGTRCVAVNGGTVIFRGGLAPFFYCENGGVVVGELDTSEDVWSAVFFAEERQTSKDVAVVTAWL